jgi:hypothetical protein
MAGKLRGKLGGWLCCVSDRATTPSIFQETARA